MNKLRIGLVGWAVRTGLGNQHADLFATGIIDRWLVPAHPILGIDDLLCPPGAIRCRRSGDVAAYHQFLDSIEALVVIEQPPLDGFDLVREASRRGITVCLVPNIEWLPDPKESPQLRDVDCMFAPTEWSWRALQSVSDRAARQGATCRWQDKIGGGRWGVNLRKFQFRERGVVARFVFCNGYGGVEGRKGAAVIGKAAALAPEVKILARSQRANLPPMPPNVEVVVENVDDRRSLYDDGEVFLAPSYWEGLGLQLYEAQACGMPVVTTDAPPMNEAGPVIKINVASRGVASHTYRAVDKSIADPAHLAAIMRELNGKPVNKGSREAREYVVAHHNDQEVATELVDFLCRVRKGLPIAA